MRRGAEHDARWGMTTAMDVRERNKETRGIDGNEKGGGCGDKRGVAQEDQELADETDTRREGIVAYTNYKRGNEHMAD